MKNLPGENHCGIGEGCSLSTHTSQTELRAIQLFSEHLRANSQYARVLCNPESSKCDSNTDFMLEIDDDLWFIEHTILGFDSQIEDRMKVATKKFEEPLMKQAKTRDIRLVVTLTFRSPTVTDTECEHMLGTLVNHLEKYDKGHVRLNMTYSLFNDSIAIQISNNSHQIASFGNLTIGFTLGLSNKLEEQFEIANRESLTKKFKKQLRRVGEVQKNALIIDQTYKLKEDGTIFHGNHVFPKDFIKAKIEEIAANTPHEVDQVWLIGFDDQVSIICEWA